MGRNIYTHRNQREMNTKFNYLYRDASNYKNWGEVIFKGEYTPEMAVELTEYLDEGRYFIAHQVDIPEMFFDYGKDSIEDDHCWHEYGDMVLTEQEPTDPRTIQQFIQQVKEESELGWEEFDNHLGTHL